MRRSWVLSILVAGALHAQAVDNDFFEREIRPVLVNKCFGCHSSKLKAPMGGLLLDSKAGLRRVIVPGDPEASRLLRAIRYTDPQLRMPPTGKLSDREIAAFATWISGGAPDPREESTGAVSTATSARKPIDLESGRRWWSFQPVREVPAPQVTDPSWVRRKIDSFLLAKLEAGHLKPSPEADPATLITRATLDLTGLRPTFDEVEAFRRDHSPAAYQSLVDRLLASQHYGERWGRYWLDVARFAEDNPTSEATNPAYLYAWRYRDWVIEALNRDVPYDRFVKLQLAADQVPGTSRADLAALGFLGVAPVYHKDARLSRDVIETLYTDDWDERVDAVSRGLMGMTVACARCHDHKFDPIPTKDYYGMVSVFASTVQAPRPAAELDAASESRFMWAAQRMFFLNYAANLMRGEPGTKPEESFAKADRFEAECKAILAGWEPAKEQHPELYQYLARMIPAPRRIPPPPGAPKPPDPPPQPRQRPNRPSATEPFTNSVFDAGLWVDGSDADLTTIRTETDKPHDMRVLQHGSVTSPGDPAPRHFLSVLAKDDGAFHQGSGRLELAGRIFADAAPLAARVIVNRVWAWHFGQGLVGTPSDFGAQGDKPTHPELLDDLAARFIANGWSFKWLHREIMLSAVYRQASRPRDDGLAADASNRLLWRMNPRRLDVEAYRDSILQAAGTLSDTASGPSLDLDAAGNTRRTVFGRVSRTSPNTLLRLYDFPSANLHSPEREITTTPLQQLFVMNSDFIQAQSEALAKLAQAGGSASEVQTLYHRLFQREPDAREVELARQYLESTTLARYAQALLSTNEVIFWP